MSALLAEPHGVAPLVSWSGALGRRGREAAPGPYRGGALPGERAALRALPERSFEVRQVELVTVSRQALVRVDGAQYSVPSRWSSSQATAYVGVADIVLEWREERITIHQAAARRLDGPVPHYLDELAAKPQAVRQVAPELMAELGAPYERLWRLLSTRYGELEAARAVAKPVGAIVEHGERLVARRSARRWPRHRRRRARRANRS